MADLPVSSSTSGVTRRDFLKIVGLTGAGALAGCAAPPAERMLPYITPPDDQVLGLATWYATTCLECPSGCGLHVRTREGRALKLEGNPNHPVNQGTLCVRGQASLQGLYNPDRITAPRARDGNKWSDLTWEEAEKRLTEKLHAAGGKSGAIQFWTGATSGSWNELLDEWCAAFGIERVPYETFDSSALREAARRAFGSDAIPVFDLARAKYVLSLGADFLDTWGMPLAQARGYEAMHGARAATFGKHVQAEPRLSLTGHSADEWLAIRPGSEGILALALLQRLGAGGGVDLARAAQECDVPQPVLERIAGELAASRPALVLGPGAAASGANATEVWAAVFALNRALGAIGTTVLPSPGFDPGKSVSFGAVRKSVQRLGSGSVSLLLVHGVNPAYALAGGVPFTQAASRAQYRVSFSSYFDETTQLCDLVLPDHHPLESWGDREPVRGVRGLVQPVMLPVFQTKQTADVLLSVARGGGGASAARFADAGFREYVMRRWGGNRQAFDAALAKGGDLPASLPAGGGGGAVAPASLSAAPLAGQGDFTLVVYPHSHYYDGRGANKPWLREIPDPVTKVVWDSWCEVHPETAKRLGVGTGDGLALETETGHAELPVFVNLAMRRDVIAVPLGLGHTQYGRYAKDWGVNALTLLPAVEDATSGARAFLATRVRARASGKHHKLVYTGGPGRQGDRAIARAIPLALIRPESGAAAIAAPGSPGQTHAQGSVPGTEEVHVEEHAEGSAPAGSPFARGPAGGPEGVPPALTFPGYRDRPTQLDGLHEKPVAKEGLPPTGSNQYNRAHHRWGMAIDVDACIGCNACVVACQAENNISWVGRDNIVRGRDMVWIRIERYYEDVEGGVETRFVPMLCQHCDNAPCETVCPVYATYHNPEGLNVQVYNRCVGTRYCSNNCPYKVRSFNWFDYNCWVSPLDQQLNPDVTVRSKGIMEKCTFCIQRIRQGKDSARDQGRDVRDGDITPACAQTCPTQAIVFGDLLDPESRVSQHSRDARSYRVLGDLNTLPAIAYLKKVSRRATTETPEPGEAATGSHAESAG